MSADQPPREDFLPEFSRRKLLQSGAGLTALAATPVAVSGPRQARNKNPGAPYRSMRDFVAALDSRGLLVRIPKADQDEYEAAALFYRMRDEYGMRGAPALLFEQVRIDGEWIKGPLLVNESGNADGECLAFGLEPVSEAPLSKPPYRSYRRARDHAEQMLRDNDGHYPLIAPVEIDRSDAPCKEVMLTGDDIDLTRFAFIQCNPGDAGRYINTGVVFTRHPKYGVNLGTYRCHLRGPREIALNSEPGQTGYRHLMAAKSRGEKTAKVSIALTVDPYVWMVSGSKLSIGKDGPVDEMSIAGGLAGRPAEVVRSETNEFRVPAWAEMIIEGEVPLDDQRPEGPYGEMAGYQGPVKDQVFWLRVTAVTHRRNPWVMNNFTGAQIGALAAASHAATVYKLRQAFPFVTDWIYDTRAVGLMVASIDKTQAGQGMAVASYLAEKNFASKTVIVVDSDVDITDHEQVLAAVNTRWQPDGFTNVYKALPALPLDPSSPSRGRGSKIAIDATRALPTEGRTKPWPPMNRSLLETKAPNAFARVDEQWGELIRGWRKRG